jgi:hypothetical protein
MFMRDSMAVATVYQCPFLFDFVTRLLSFRLVSADLRSALVAIAKDAGATIDTKEVTADTIQVHVHRDAIFIDGVNILTHFGCNQSRLKVSFIGEAGIGLGPTHEFFTLFSHELCRPSARLFRTDKVDTDFAVCQRGMFLSPEAPSRGVAILGIFLAKALQMGCLVDIAINPALWRFLRGQKVEVAEVDPMVAQSLRSPNGLVGLPFVYPGLQLALGDGEVTTENLPMFINAVAEATCGEGMAGLRDAFVEGFERVMPFWVLDPFDENEVCALLRGDGSRFGIDDIERNVRLEHGYTRESPEIQMLFEVLAEFDVEQQKMFVQFVTGFSQLPIGGLAALDPKLTIAKREDFERHPDDMLPSVMTCTNYFKMPPYSSKEIMKERILRAITDGINAFDLT